YGVYSMDRYEANQPYNKWRNQEASRWRKIAKRCGGARIKQASDPTWIASHGTPSLARPS
ncbi:MAG TPA: hypothetical protein VJ718_05330, partial [Candidatus Binataceae bacterium]|nr:hypothetical protein [Candidatus Binataceae bacterium]